MTTHPDPPPHRAEVAELHEQFRQHAAWCATQAAPLYAELLRGLADDWRDGGVARRLCSPFEGDPPGHAVQLRILGALHRLVLAGEAPSLAPFYRSVGGAQPPDRAWPVARRVLQQRERWVGDQLALPPQTNEVGRATALAVLLAAARARTGLHRVRLLEIGASAGLNLRVDAFRITGDGFTWGPPTSPVALLNVVRGVPQTIAAASDGIEIVHRAGCDLDPVDIDDPSARLWLQSFVWPDHVERFHRLGAALAVAAGTPVEMERADAADWLARRLATPAPDGVLTVVWHSVMRQYVPDDAWRRVQGLVANARGEMPLVHLALEPVGDANVSGHGLWLDGEVVGRAQPHGIPAVWGV